MNRHDKHFRLTRWPLAFGLALLLARFAVVPSAATSSTDAAPDGNGPARSHQTAAVQRVVGYKAFAGKLAQVEVIVASKPGVDPATAAAKALHAVGATATPPWPGFLLSGFIWSEFSDHSRRNDSFTMSYNPAGDPTGGNGQVALGHAMTTWNSVPGSTFRFTFGGVTTRCSSLAEECTGGAPFLGIPGAPYADGYDDFAWVRIQVPPGFPGVIFGYCETLFDPFTGKAYEADLVLNSDVSPFAWATDGASDVDLESVLLHELGHALGLAHAFNEDALMYFDYTGVKRTLTAAEINGVLTLYSKHPSLLSDTPSAHDFSVVAEAYTPAPGGGEFQDVFEAAGTNSRGDVAFVTNVPEGQGLFVVSGNGSVRQIVRSGMAAPGGLEFGLGSAEEAAINELGEVAFCWLLGPVDLPFGINGGIFLAEANGSLRAVVLPGVTPAPGGGVFVGCDTASVSNQGDVAFTGFVRRGSGLEQGAFVARRDGTVMRIAGPGDIAPGGGHFSSAQFPKLAPNSGTVVFEAAVDGSPNLGVYARRGATGSVEAIVRPGDPAPGGGTILRARGRAKVNSRGEVLFGALVQLSSPPIRPTELFLVGQDRVTRRVAGYGDTMPDGFRFGTLVTVWNSWTLNESGDVSFVARTESLPMPYFQGLAIFETTGVYASSRGQLRFVAREGSVLAGLGQMISVSPTTAPAMIDERGDVVFEVFTDAGRMLLLRAASRVR